MKISFICLFVFIILQLNYTGFGQHEQHAPQKKEPVKTIPQKAVFQEHDSLRYENTENWIDTMPMMSHSYSLNLPMNRNSSGTAWQPDATSM